MQFDHIDKSYKYLDDILCIIRQGILQKQSSLNKCKREGLRTQLLAETFNIIGANVSKNSIFAQKEHEREGDFNREDIYFYLSDDNYTRIFYIEAKRLPKYKSKTSEEYVTGISTSNKPSGGIQRFKSGRHGDYNLNYNGIIAFVENKSIEEWFSIVNNKLLIEYPNDTLLTPTNYSNEFRSTHSYLQREKETFVLCHFWIDLTKSL